MGASLSNLTDNGAAMGPGLGDIPESCVACVFLYLSPPEICNLARLNRAFRGAASSDSVWEKKLPANYQDLLDLVPRERYLNMSKKDIFALLSRPVPFDNGNKEVWIDRVTGRVCMSISAQAMAITGIEDRRYWSWIPTEESRIFSTRFLTCNAPSGICYVPMPFNFTDAGGLVGRFGIIIFLRLFYSRSGEFGIIVVLSMFSMGMGLAWHLHIICGKCSLCDFFCGVAFISYGAYGIMKATFSWSPVLFVLN